MCMNVFLLGTLLHTSMGSYRLHCKVLHNEFKSNITSILIKYYQMTNLFSQSPNIL